MQIVERGQLLVVRDRPGCRWVAGLWLVARGVLVLLIPLVAVDRAEVPWYGRVAVLGIGLATLGAGLLAIRASPATTTELDAAAGTGRVTTRGFARATRTETFPLADVRALEVTSERDGDGDGNRAVRLRLRLRLAGGRAVWLQANPVYEADTLEDPAARIWSFLCVAAGPSCARRAVPHWRSPRAHRRGCAPLPGAIRGGHSRMRATRSSARHLDAERRRGAIYRRSTAP